MELPIVLSFLVSPSVFGFSASERDAPETHPQSNLPKTATSAEQEQYPAHPFLSAPAQRNPARALSVAL